MAVFKKQTSPSNFPTSKRIRNPFGNHSEITMTQDRLKGRRVLVLGASAGIGKATSIALSDKGARVALAARRQDVLDSALSEVGSDSIGILCDVSDPEACERVVETASTSFGGLDAVVYAPGITELRAIEDLDASAWKATFETNLFGAALITRAALPHLQATRGKVVYFSSISIDDRPPRVGMAAYIASKVALESMAQAWQGEHPSVGFTTLAIGDTLTEKVGQTDPELVRKFVPKWFSAGLMPGRLMNAESVADQVVSILASREHVRRVAITPAPSDTAEIPGLNELGASSPSHKDSDMKGPS